MKELFFAPVVEFPTNALGTTGRRIKEQLSVQEQSEWEKDYREYWKLLEERAKALPLRRGFRIYLQITPEGAKLSKILAGIKKDGGRGENPDHLVVDLLERRGQLVQIDSNYIVRKVLQASQGLTKAMLEYRQREVQAYSRDYLELMSAVGAYRASVINRTLKDGQQGILLEYGDTGRTLNFLTDDIVVNRIIPLDEYTELTKKIPQTERRF